MELQDTIADKGLWVTAKEPAQLPKPRQTQPWTTAVSVSSAPAVLEKCFLPSLFGFSRFPLTCAKSMVLSTTYRKKNWQSLSAKEVYEGVIVKDFKTESFFIMVGSEINMKRIKERWGVKREERGDTGTHSLWRQIG